MQWFRTYSLPKPVYALFKKHGRATAEEQWRVVVEALDLYDWFIEASPEKYQEHREQVKQKYPLQKG